MLDPSSFKCLNCAERKCECGADTRPVNCTEQLIDSASHRMVLERYADPETHAVMEAASRTVQINPMDTRVQNIMNFAAEIGAKRIGIASCSLLRNESRVFAKLLTKAGFEVFGTICKIEGNSSHELELDLEKPSCALCNPIMQAALLEQAETDLNVVVGLCVGHDAIFYKYSHAFVTTLVAKDKCTGHNPAVVLYESESLFKRRLEETAENVRERLG